MASVSSSRRPWWKLIGVAMFVLFVWTTDIAAIARAISSLTGAVIILSFTLAATNLLVKAVRWHGMVVAFAPQLSRPQTTLAFMEGMLWGAVTFGRLGELWRGQRLHDYGAPLGPAVASSVLDRIFDLIALCALGIAGAAWMGGLSTSLSITLFGGLHIAALGMLTAIKTTWPTATSEPKTMVAKVTNKVGTIISSSATMITIPGMSAAMTWTWLGWGCNVAALSLLAGDMGVAPRTAVLATAFAVSSLSTLLPITWQGVGAREPIFAAMLASDGVPAAAAAALSIAMFAVGLFTALSLGGLASLWMSRRGSVLPSSS